MICRRFDALYCCRDPVTCRFPNYPVFGTDAVRPRRRSCRRDHQSPSAKRDAHLADRIYSGVPAAMFGRRQEIEIGPMSGESNVAYWLERRRARIDGCHQRVFGQPSPPIACSPAKKSCNAAQGSEAT